MEDARLEDVARHAAAQHVVEQNLEVEQPAQRLPRVRPRRRADVRALANVPRRLARAALRRRFAARPQRVGVAAPVDVDVLRQVAREVAEERALQQVEVAAPPARRRVGARQRALVAAALAVVHRVLANAALHRQVVHRDAAARLDLGHVVGVAVDDGRQPLERRDELGARDLDVGVRAVGLGREVRRPVAVLVDVEVDRAKGQRARRLEVRERALVVAGE